MKYSDSQGSNIQSIKKFKVKPIVGKIKIKYIVVPNTPVRNFIYACERNF